MLKLKRPVVARIATITDWPVILIDLITEERIVGLSYLEHYTIDEISDLGSARFRRYAQGAVRRTRRTLRSRTLVAARIGARANNVQAYVLGAPLGPRSFLGNVVHLMYCDETNLEERKGAFFVYAGVVVEGVRARDLSHRIDSIRTAAKVPANYRLKFNPGPEGLDHQQFIDLKKAVIAAATDAKVGLLVSAILHDIATSPEIARLNAINTLCYFDCLLGRVPGPGLVLMDRFTDKQIDAHLAQKFSVGVTGLPHTAQLRLSNVVGFHYAAVGQSHFSSLRDCRRAIPGAIASRRWGADTDWR